MSTPGPFDSYFVNKRFIQCGPEPEKEVDLYLEAHVTIEPVFGERALEAKTIAAKYGFVVADLLMQKNRQPTDERSDKDMFMTGHGRFVSAMKNRTKALVQELRKAGYRVWRYKIEDTLVDSRCGDEMGLLS